MAPSNESRVNKKVLIKRKRDPFEQDQSSRPEKQQHSASNACTQTDSPCAFLVGSTRSIGAASSNSDRPSSAASSSPNYSNIAASSASSASSGSDQGSSSSNRNWAPPTPTSLSPVAADPFHTRLESNVNVIVNYNRLIITTYLELKRTKPHLATIEYVVGLFDDFAENALPYPHLGIDGIEAAILLYGLSRAPTYASQSPVPVAHAQAPVAQAQSPATEAQAIPQQMPTPPGETQTLPNSPGVSPDSQTGKSSHNSGYNLRSSRAHRKGK